MKIKIGKRTFSTIGNAARFYRKSYQTFYARFKFLGWSKLEAAQTPVRKYERR